MSERKFTQASFNQFLAEHKLMGTRCRSCAALYLPPRPLCASCHSPEVEWVEFSGEGILVGMTTIYVGPTAMIEAGYRRENPYCTGVVQLTEGPAISAQILGIDPSRPEEIQIGLPVHSTFIDRGTAEARRTYLAFNKKDVG
jgi:uncharacterized protein